MRNIQTNGCQGLLNGVIFQSGLVFGMFTGATMLATAVLSAKKEEVYSDVVCGIFDSNFFT